MESIPDYKKIVLKMFLIKNDFEFVHEGGCLKNDKNRLCLEFQKKLNEQNEDYLDYIKNDEESLIKKISNEFKRYFATMFQDARLERSLILLLSLTDSHILKQSKITDPELNTL